MSETPEQKERRKLAHRLGALIGADAGRDAADALDGRDVGALAYNGARLVRAVERAIADAVARRGRQAWHESAAVEHWTKAAAWRDKEAAWHEIAIDHTACSFARDLAAEGEGGARGEAWRNAELAAEHDAAALEASL